MCNNSFCLKVYSVWCSGSHSRTLWVAVYKQVIFFLPSFNFQAILSLSLVILFVCFRDWAGLVHCHLWCPHSDHIPGDTPRTEAFRGGLLIVWSPLSQWGSAFDLRSVCGLETFSFRERYVCCRFRQGGDSQGSGPRGHSTGNTHSRRPSGWRWLQPHSLITFSLVSLSSPEGPGTTGITSRRHPPRMSAGGPGPAMPGCACVFGGGARVPLLSGLEAWSSDPATTALPSDSLPPLLGLVWKCWFCSLGQLIFCLVSCLWNLFPSQIVLFEVSAQKTFPYFYVLSRFIKHPPWVPGQGQAAQQPTCTLTLDVNPSPPTLGPVGGWGCSHRSEATVGLEYGWFQHILI